MAANVMEIPDDDYPPTYGISPYIKDLNPAFFTKKHINTSIIKQAPRNDTVGREMSASTTDFCPG